MQAALKFFDFPFKGAAGEGARKIGIKLPDQTGQDASGTEGDFMAIMTALTQLPPQELAATLDQLEWIPVEENSAEFVPLIDLTAQGKENPNFVKSLAPKQHMRMQATSGQSGLTAFHQLNTADAHEKPMAQLEAQQALQSSELPRNSKLVLSASSLPHAELPHIDGKQTTAEVTRQIAGDQQMLGLGERKETQDPNGIRLALTDQLAKNELQKPENTAGLGSVRDGQPLRSNLFDARSGRDIHKSAQDKLYGNTGQFQNPRAATNKEQVAQPAMNDGQVSPPKGQQAMRLVSASAALQGSFAQSAIESSASNHDVILPVTDQNKDVHFKEMIRMDSTARHGDQVVTNGSSDGADAQSQNNANREGTPSFDARANLSGTKSIDQGGSAKEVLPFVEKETHTDVIRQIVQRMTLRTEKQQPQMVIRLKPDFLGSVRMLVTTENQQVIVRMEAESAMVKEIIEQNMTHLKAELHQHGLEIEKFDVFVGNDNDQSRSSQQQTALRQGLKRNGDRQNNNDASSDEDDDQQSQTSDERRTITGNTQSSEVDYFV